MTHKYELNRRYEFEATADGVCPVPDDAEVIVWIKSGTVEIKSKAGLCNWDMDGLSYVTHFMVISYPKTKHKAWVDIYPDGDAYWYKTRKEAEAAASDDIVCCIEIEWEAE